MLLYTEDKMLNFQIGLSVEVMIYAFLFIANRQDKISVTYNVRAISPLNTILSSSNSSYPLHQV